MDMTQDSIYRLFWRVGFPIAVGMFFNTMYNFVDTYFAGYLGSDVLAGVSISFPVFLILYAIAQSLGSASNALIANAIGAKEEEKVGKYLCNAMIMGIIAWVILSLILLFFLRSIYARFHLSPEAVDAGVRYIHVFIFFGGSLFMIFGSILNAVFSANGMTKIFRNLLILNFFINLVLDPIFALGLSFGTGGVILPKMGVVGLAIATVLVQYIGFFILLYVAVKKKMVRDFRWSLFRLDPAYVKEIFTQALPSFFAMISVSLAMFIHNKFVSDFGQEAVAAYGVGIRIEQVALLINASLAISLTIIVGQNNGAKHYGRIIEAFWKALLIGFGIMIIFYGFVFIFAPLWVGFFTQDQQTLAMGAHYVRTQILTFYAYVIIQTSGSLLQGIKRPGVIIYNEFYRHIVASFIFIYPFVTVFNWGIDGVWYGITIKSWTAAIFIMLWAIYQYKKLVRITPST